MTGGHAAWRLFAAAGEIVRLGARRRGRGSGPSRPRPATAGDRSYPVREPRRPLGQPQWARSMAERRPRRPIVAHQAPERLPPSALHRDRTRAWLPLYPETFTNAGWNLEAGPKGRSWTTHDEA